MSALTTTPLKSAPSAAVGTSVAIGAGSAWANSGYTELLAAASADLYVAALVVVPSSGITQFEIDLATGSAGSESVVATIPGVSVNSGNSGFPCWLPLPVPVQVIASGARVAARIRTSATSAESITMTLLYYAAAPGDNYTTLPPACVPSAASGVSVTPSGTGWANSSWVQVTSGLGTAIQMYGLAWQVPTGISNIDIEVDIGTGGAGSETVVATLRAALVGTVAEKLWYLLLPALYAVPASTRIAVRMRKSGTNTTAHTFKLAYLTGSLASPPAASSFPALMVAM